MQYATITGRDACFTLSICARFERFYVCPVCSPARAEFLTGRYHPRGGVYSTSTGGERLESHWREARDAAGEEGRFAIGFKVAVKDGVPAKSSR